MTATARQGALPSRPETDPKTTTSEVNTVSTTDLQRLQPADIAVAPRSKTPAPAAAPVCALTSAPYGKAANGITGNGIVGSWLATSRLSMTVPAFHDRRPLCST